MRTAAMLPFPACHSQSFVLFACYTQSWLSAIILTVSLFSCVFLFFAGRWHSRHRGLSVWTLQRCGNPVEERSQRSRPAECEPPLHPLLWPLSDQRPLNVSMSVCQEHDGWLHTVPQQLESTSLLGDSLPSKPSSSCPPISRDGGNSSSRRYDRFLRVQIQFSTIWWQAEGDRSLNGEL